MVSDALARLRSTARSLVPRLRTPALCRIPPRSPQRGLSPNHQRAGCPRVALARVNQTTPLANPQQRVRRNTEALFQSLRLLAQILCESQAARPQRNQSHARRADATGTRSCSASPRALSFAVSKSTGDLPFSLSRRNFTYAVQGLLARSSLRSTLSRYGFISLGFSKKYSGVYEAFLASWAISMSSTIARMRCCWPRGNLLTSSKSLRALPVGPSFLGGVAAPISCSVETSSIFASAAKYSGLMPTLRRSQLAYVFKGTSSFSAT